MGKGTGRKRFFNHGTVVGYVALFFALGGSSLAATHIASAARGKPHRKVPKVKVVCSAKQGKKKIGCSVVTGAVGPRGPQGPQGSPGPKGDSGTTGGTGATPGPTVLTQAPGYTYVTTSAPSCATYTSAGVGASGTPINDELDSFTGSSTCAKTVGGNELAGVAATVTGTESTYLLSPSQIDGSAENLKSVEFCYGAGTGTSGTGSEEQSASMTITGAAVYEFDETTAAATGGGSPPYTTTTLINTPLNLSGTSNCETITPSGAAQIDPSGYLMLRVFSTFYASAGYDDPSENYAQPYVASALLSLGRVTATYGP